MNLPRLILAISLFITISITGFSADFDDEAKTRTEQIGEIFFQILEQGNVPLVEYYLASAASEGIDLANFSDTSHCPSLSHIIGVKHMKDDMKVGIAEILLKHGAKIDDRFGEECNAMRRAVRCNSLSMFNFLCEHGAKIPEGLLDLAARLPDKTIAQKLLQLKTEEPAISAAVWLNDEKLLEEAVACSKDFPSDLALALEVAIRNKNRLMAEAVLAKGAQPTLAAAAFLGKAEYLDLAHVKATNPNAPIIFEGERKSPLLTALSLGYSDVAGELVGKFRARTHELLSDAVRMGDVKTLRGLLDCGANIRYIYPWGRSIVMLALESKKYETLPSIVALLLEKQPNLGQADGDGNTVAHYAARLPSDSLALEMLGILKNAGARLNRYNIRAKTPRMEAWRVGNARAAKYLQRNNVAL